MTNMKNNMNEIIEALVDVQDLYDEQGMTLHDIENFMYENASMFYLWSFCGQAPFFASFLVSDIQACAADFGYEVIINVDEFDVYYELIEL